jgi:hypothetical protein
VGQEWLGEQSREGEAAALLKRNQVSAMFVAEQCKPVMETTLYLLGGPYVVNNGRRLEISEGSKRLVVL